MSKYNLKASKIGNNVINNYKKIEEKFVDSFLEEGSTSKCGYTMRVGKGGDAVLDIYKKVEDVVVSSYNKVEDKVVNGYRKIEDKFIDAFLEEVDSNENK